MAHQPIDKKKRIEMSYLEEARRASSLFPTGALIPHERPDFLLLSSEGTIGIEVTELCRQGPRAESARIGRVPHIARERHNRRPDTTPVDVSAAFSRTAEHLGVRELASSLADFVYAHRFSNTGFTRDLPDGFCNIGVFALIDSNGLGQWRGFQAFDTALASKSLIELRIAEKNRRVPDYRVAAPQAWLLIVNDLFLGAGEVLVPEEDLAQWAFDFYFDKVLLFSRQAGGDGNVISLRRSPSSSTSR